MFVCDLIKVDSLGLGNLGFLVVCGRMYMACTGLSKVVKIEDRDRFFSYLGILWESVAMFLSREDILNMLRNDE